MESGDEPAALFAVDHIITPHLFGPYISYEYRAERAFASCTMAMLNTLYNTPTCSPVDDGSTDSGVSTEAPAAPAAAPPGTLAVQAVGIMPLSVTHTARRTLLCADRAQRSAAANQVQNHNLPVASSRTRPSEPRKRLRIAGQRRVTQRHSHIAQGCLQDARHTPRASTRRPRSPQRCTAAAHAHGLDPPAHPGAPHCLPTASQGPHPRAAQSRRRFPNHGREKTGSLRGRPRSLRAHPRRPSAVRDA